MNKIISNQIHQSIKAMDRKNSTPVLLAMLDWYEELEESDQEIVQELLVNVIGTIRNRKGGSKLKFGAKAGLELLGVWLALSQGWLGAGGVRHGYGGG
jgi:hypothetical protein